LLRDAWALAIEALSWIELSGLSESAALSKTSKQLGITDMGVKGLAYRLVYEAVRRKNYLDRLIDEALKPDSLNDYDLGLQAFLRLYTYKTKVDHEGNVRKQAVEIAHIGRAVLGWKTLQPVEKALGKLLGISEDSVLKGLDDVDKVALTTFHPTFFVEYCFRLFGRSEALKFLESSQKSLPIYIRLNTLKAPEEEIIAALEREGLSIEKVSMLQHVFKITKARQPLVKTRSFRDGFFCMQDVSSALVAEAAAAESVTTVFDICAAPGDKTGHLAMQMENAGLIYALDYSKRGMRTLKANLARYGVENVSLVQGDARASLPFSKEADLVVLDAPSSESGVLARVPSVRWRLTSEFISRMAQVQWQMLRSCADAVQEGGVLVYCTNSICVEENEMQVEQFLRAFPEFKLVETLPSVGLPGLRGLEKCQRLYPHIHNCEGAFLARFQRVS
jgi:16S rRNA (cytosine967-C5)-methyltransferase